MPKIILKYKSPEFANEEEKQVFQNCEMPACQENADHKAPKHRGLDDYHHFCSTHISEYNKAWDFFSGMSEREIHDHMKRSTYGDRPTWKHNTKEAEEEIYRAAKNTYNFDSNSDDSKNNAHKRKFYGDRNTPEHEAMAIFGLSPPVTQDEMKTRYKTLAKKHHPDLNRDNPDAEETLKKINMAYTILKIAFEEYKNITEHEV